MMLQNMFSEESVIVETFITIAASGLFASQTVNIKFVRFQGMQSGIPFVTDITAERSTEE